MPTIASCSEGEPDEEIVFVGNVMIDTLLRAVQKSGLRRPDSLPLDAPIVVTLHRPSNVDDVERLERIMASLREVTRTRLRDLPVHPRTAA